MKSRQEILKKLRPLLDHHREVAVEFDDRGLVVLLKKVRPNLLGNFAGGDMAYAAAMLEFPTEWCQESLPWTCLCDSSYD